MRIQVAGSPQAGRLLALTAGVVVAVALALALGGAAWAAPIPERAYSESSAPQTAPVVVERSYSESSAPQAAPVVVERSYSEAPAVAATPAPPAAPAAPAVLAAPTDGGMGAFLIAAIVFGGIVALCAVAYTARRVAHGHAAH
jgi:hypothetical protein